MTERIAPLLIENAVDWQSIIEDTTTDNGRYINSFASSWRISDKKNYATVVGDRNVSMGQFANYVRHKRGKSEAEDKALLFSVTPDNSGIKLVPALHSLKAKGTIKDGSRITQIGLVTPNKYLPLSNRNAMFTVGNDLEFLAELFNAKVTGLSRSAFSASRARTVKPSTRNMPSTETWLV